MAYGYLELAVGQLATIFPGLDGGIEITTFIANFTSSDRYIYDYPTDEVLAQRPPETQSFLLQTAILDPFNADLRTAVTANPKSNPFSTSSKEPISFSSL